ALSGGGARGGHRARTQPLSEGHPDATRAARPRAAIAGSRRLTPGESGAPLRTGGSMAKWVFEPGHTAAEFCARHMMVTYVRGHFKGVHGTLNFDSKSPGKSSAEVVIDAYKIWTGEPARDDHLRSADFLDVENFPEIRFRGDHVVV